jgi:hypothetical protein
MFEVVVVEPSPKGAADKRCNNADRGHKRNYCIDLIGLILEIITSGLAIVLMFCSSTSVISTSRWYCIDFKSESVMTHGYSYIIVEHYLTTKYMPTKQEKKAIS